jgi:hypothetical protein
VDRPADPGRVCESTTRWTGIGEGFNPVGGSDRCGPADLPDRLLVDI